MKTLGSSFQDVQNHDITPQSLFRNNLIYISETLYIPKIGLNLCIGFPRNVLRILLYAKSFVSDTGISFTNNNGAFLSLYLQLFIRDSKQCEAILGQQELFLSKEESGVSTIKFWLHK